MAILPKASRPTPTIPAAAPPAAAKSLPVRTAPTTSRIADASEEITPATTNVQTATVASTPSCLNRRNTNIRLICEPANGSVADRALPA